MTSSETTYSDLFSMSISLVYIIPISLFLITREKSHIISFIGVTIITILSESLKYFIFGQNFKRPQGAKNCNYLCNDGNQAGRPGMPSSHSAEATFFASFYFSQTSNIYIRIGLILYAMGVMISRYIKKCHTVEQIVVGSLLGLSGSLFTVRLL